MKKFGLTGLLVMLVACYPGDVSSLSELDVLLTVRSTEFDFGPVTTFAMPDEIHHINTDDPDAIEIPRDNDDEILAKVRQNLLALGWEELTEDDVDGGRTPGVVVLNLATASSNTQWWVTYPPGGCWWYPCWGGGWYWPPQVGVTSYDAGTYFMIMADPTADPVANDGRAAVWGGAFNGILSSSSGSNLTRLLNGIDQAFDQSPYLSGSSN